MSNTVIASDKLDNPVDSFEGVNVIKNVDFVLDNHSHSTYLKRIIGLVKNESFVRDGNDLCRLVGLPHQNKGGDFSSFGLPGDLKFLTENAKVCLGGKVDMKTIHEQGKMLVMVYHPRKDMHTPVYAGYLDVWSVKGTQDEAIDLVYQWTEWVKNGRKNESETKFVSNNFFIELHDQDDDRFYVKPAFVKENIQYFCKNESYVQKTGMQARISRFHSSASVNNKVSQNKSVEYKSMSLTELLKNLENNVFFIPKYQRELLPNNEFLKNYVVSTIMSGQAENRGVFMFHDVGDGKIAVVDGQQRLYNAIKGFFIGNFRLPASAVTVVFDGKTRDLSNLTWPELIDMSKEDIEIKKFVDFVNGQKFVCKVYKNYTYNDMAAEYRIANSGAQMNRQELRASFDSRLGDIVRHITTPSLRDPVISKAGIKTFDKEIFSIIPSKGTLKYINVPTFRMNVDSLLSYTFHTCSTWGEGYRENENIIDEAYERSTDMNTTVKAWKKTEEYLDILSSIIKHYNDGKDADKYTGSGDRGDRTHRAKGYVLAKQEEWDLVLFLVLELMRRNKGKKLEITKDVLSKILSDHYSYVKPENPIDYESSYGQSIRKGQRTWDEINKMWFVRWEKFLSYNEADLRNLGFDFS